MSASQVAVMPDRGSIFDPVFLVVIWKLERFCVYRVQIGMDLIYFSSLHRQWRDYGDDAITHLEK